MRPLTRRTVLIVSWALVGVAGAALGWRRAERQREETRRELMDDARRCALAFDGEILRRLTGTPVDLTSPAYLAVKTRLARLRLVGPEKRSLRLLRWGADPSRLILLADSEPPDSKQVANPGDEIAGIVDPPSLRVALRERGAAFEGPATGSAGTWVRGYAVIDAGTAGAGPDVLALEGAADHLRQDQWIAGAGTAGLVWLLLGLPFAGLLVWRRGVEQRHLIHKLVQAAEQSRAGIVIVRPDRRIEYVNAGFCAMSGWRRDEIVGQPSRLLAASETTEEQRQDIQATVQSGRTWRGEISHRRRDGGSFPARCVAAPLYNPAGRLTHIITVVEDVTERQQVEAALVYAKERAEAGERAKGQFLTMMSHEIRTPLNGIIGFTDLLLDTPLASEQREYVQTIRTSGESLLQLASDVLDFSRIDAGRMSLEPQPCRPLEVLESVLDLFAAHAAEKNLELLHSVAAGVPPVVLIDAARLRQVLVNLVGNAVKFTRAGEIEVTVGAERAPAAGASAPRAEQAWRLSFAVRDTGIGIAPGERGKLFKPFSQIDSSTTRQFGGAGLGLAICHSLVQMMGGEIALESEAGRGSTFTFTVVAGEVAVPARPDGLPDPGLLRGRVVGLVSTSPALRGELAGLAEIWGARAVACEREQLAGENWDVAVVDLRAAEADAWRGIFTQRPELTSRPVVALIPVDFPAPARAEPGRWFRALVRKPARHEALGMLLAASLQPPRAGAPAASAGTVPAGGLGLEILLVEGSPVSQRLTQKMLENLGCHWDLAEDGRLALSRLSRGTYDLVLLDLQLAEPDGTAVIAEIRRGHAGEKNRQVWITAVAGDPAEAQRVLTVTGGANDCLVQPFRPAELEAALRRSLTGRTGSA